MDKHVEDTNLITAQWETVDVVIGLMTVYKQQSVPDVDDSLADNFSLESMVNDKKRGSSSFALFLKQPAMTGGMIASSVVGSRQTKYKI